MTHHEMRTAAPGRTAASENYLTTTDNNESSPQDQAEIARRYAAAGTPVFPCDPATKRPLTPNGFKDASTDPGMVEAWWLQYPGAMIGCPTGAKSGWWVLDVDMDPTEGKDGEASLAALVAAHDPLPTTRIHRTPRGGRHYIFAAPPGRRIKISADLIGRWIDVRGDGGYIILPGSRRADGQAYTLERDVDPVAAPEWLIELAGERSPSRALPVDGKIAEGGRNDALTRQGGALRKVGMSAEHILNALRTINATQCNPPLDEDEVVQIARSVARYEPQAPIWEGFSESDPSTLACLIPKPPAPPRFQLLTSGELDALPTPPDLVKGLLPAEGIAVIYGASKAGKSFLLLDLLARLAKGEDWFGYRVRRAVPVVYFALEGQGGIRKRKTALEHKHGILPITFRFVTAGALDIRKPDDVAALGKAINGAGVAGGVSVIDTMARAAPGADENGSQDMGAIVAGLTALQAAVGGLVLAVHHTGKDTSKGLRGHSSLLGALDAAIEVSREGDRRTWKIDKAKDGEDGTEHAFALRVCNVGIDEDGDWLTSCYIDTENVPESARANRPTGKNLEAIFDHWTELLTASGQHGQGGAPDDVCCIEYWDLLNRATPLMGGIEHKRKDKSRDAIALLVKHGFIARGGDWLWKP